MKKISVLLVLCTILFTITGCQKNTDSSTVNSTVTVENTQTLVGHDLMIYCGAGMTNPFEEIAKAFKEKTGCEINVTYANAGQIQSQINISNEGDLFIAGSADELVPVQNYITSSIDLVKHIPVLAVKKGNPKKITGLSSLTQTEIKTVLGDNESTPIGKIANKALSDIGILTKVNVIARTTTAPALSTTIENDEADATIIWKENATKLDIVSTTELDSYIKTVPAATLSFNKDKDALTEFLEYLGTDEAKNIWINNSYEIVK
ncbi:molybdate ABC transporter substrate-binding protein [[Clostridium] fimetarium]|uniref:Molybdate transport system substrate-binding protein n=1 Tax=[Clostridium] fimetarium TaxID=99656 RepID=A0A1I0RTZ0_9FIRM|nr:molybdate ABC transporter substrate-binding protein [[Clostridium] fimetarium]SEW44749.1 molybdate transport system substrate-binding protein [[Clostridium] fimetarium]